MTGDEATKVKRTLLTRVKVSILMDTPNLSFGKIIPQPMKFMPDKNLGLNELTTPKYE